MSFNAYIVAEHEGGGAVGLLLSRVGAWVTHSAQLQKGDTVVFGNSDLDVNFRVTEVVHVLQKPGTEIAPVSEVMLAPYDEDGNHVVPLTEKQCEKLAELGFRSR